MISLCREVIVGGDYYGRYGNKEGLLFYMEVIRVDKGIAGFVFPQKSRVKHSNEMKEV